MDIAAKLTDYGRSGIGGVNEHRGIRICSSSAGHAAWSAERAHRVSEETLYRICRANKSQCLDGRIFPERRYQGPWQTWMCHLPSGISFASTACSG